MYKLKLRLSKFIIIKTINIVLAAKQRYLLLVMKFMSPGDQVRISASEISSLSDWSISGYLGELGMVNYGNPDDTLALSQGNELFPVQVHAPMWWWKMSLHEAVMCVFNFTFNYKAGLCTSTVSASNFSSFNSQLGSSLAIYHRTGKSIFSTLVISHSALSKFLFCTSFIRDSSKPFFRFR